MNPEVAVYSPAELPDAFRWQAVTLMRAQWPSIFQGGLRWMTETYPPELGTVHFVVSHAEVLIGYASLMQLELPHVGEAYRVHALGNVLVSPPYRGEGHGRRLVEAATRFIDAGGTDLGMLFCNPSLDGFYRPLGWEALPGAQTRIGTPDSYTEDADLRMMRLVSGRARAARELLGSEPFYVEWAW
jgi:GNAT superfamily N-acetyltransferase